METINRSVVSTEICFNYECVQIALDVIGGKWKAAILWHIRLNPMRFNELLRTIPNISHKMLTQQLRQLEKDHIIQRKIYTVTPQKVEYSFTEYGKTLCSVFGALEIWGKEHIKHKKVHKSQQTK